MNSPFPGMDPYLETRWSDVHTRLNIYASDAISQSLPPGLLARAEERAIVCADGAATRSIVPDVSVLERGLAEPPAAGGTAVSVAQSFDLLVEEQIEVRQRYLEIRDAQSGGRVITVIEFVSPSNKRLGDGLEKYRQKQDECRDGNVNLVEIDLTRAGDRSLIMPVDLIPPNMESTYLAVVTRWSDRGQKRGYRLPLEEKLGGIPIPLRTTDDDIVLDLQSLIDQVYRNGRYEQDLTYTEKLSPPLLRYEADWAEPLLADRIRR